MGRGPGSVRGAFRGGAYVHRVLHTSKTVRSVWALHDLLVVVLLLPLLL